MQGDSSVASRSAQTRIYWFALIAEILNEFESKQIAIKTKSPVNVFHINHGMVEAELVAVRSRCRGGLLRPGFGSYALCGARSRASLFCGGFAGGSLFHNRSASSSARPTIIRRFGFLRGQHTCIHPGARLSITVLQCCCIKKELKLWVHL